MDINTALFGDYFIFNNCPQFKLNFLELEVAPHYKLENWLNEREQ